MISSKALQRKGIQSAKLGKHTETGEEIVVYQDIAYPEKVWTRTVAMLMEKVMVD